MRKYFIILLLLFPLFVFASEYKDVVEVKKSLNQFVESWNQGDMNAALDIYKNSPQSSLISSSVIKGYAEIEKFWKTNYPNKDEMGKMAFSDIDVKLLSPKYAMAIGQWTLKGTKNDTGGIFTVLFEKTDKGWKSVVDHTTGL